MQIAASNLNYARRELALAQQKRRAANRFYGQQRSDLAKRVLGYATGELNSKRAQLKRAARDAHRQLWEAGKTSVTPR